MIIKVHPRTEPLGVLKPGVSNRILGGPSHDSDHIYYWLINRSYQKPASLQDLVRDPCFKLIYAGEGR